MCLFNRDPLVEDWSETNPSAGPLRSQEENWSQWLAHLLRSSSGEFTRELFGESFDCTPTSVRRELVYRDEELHDRRVDILVEWANRGVSIEVKIDDEEYAKTPQTAYLTEKHHSRNIEWTHLILLPERKHTALSDTFGARIEDQGENRPTIASNGAEELDVTVVYWHEVSQALRRVLLDNTESSPHWMASGYLFITLIEQKIERFYTNPAVLAYLDAPVSVSDLDRLQTIDPREQIEYLTGTLEVNDE